MTAGHKWKRLQRAHPKPATEALIASTMRVMGIDREEAISQLDLRAREVELWINDLYQVEVRRNPEIQAIHLNIRRRDGFVGRDWRHFQQIKNELVGPECEGIELYPAESRLTDTSNKYHLWCSTDPTFRFPVGFQLRGVEYGTETEPGLRQRPPMEFANQETTDAEET